MLHLLLPLLAPTTIPACAVPGDAPPGHVLVPGGRTKLGTDPDAVEKMLADNPSLWGKAGAYWSMTPETQVAVDDFYLMVTEVTNEQYAQFVRLTNAKPPEHFGAKAIDAARAAFLEEEGRRREEAKAAGEKLPERQVFDETAWWNGNWQGAEWEVPAGSEHLPVVYVDHRGASAYARWAGLRLPSEAEYVRAVRGDGDADWPWGAEWKAENAATKELKGVRGTMPVGSFPQGATKAGIHDLIGNVWEWTSSPYSPLPKFKAKTLSFGTRKDRKEVEARPNWDANERIMVGGCYHSDRHEARAVVRAGIERHQTADAIGFRTAASTKPGIDIAATVLVDDLPMRTRPALKDGLVQYDIQQSLAIDHWRARSPGAGAVEAADGGNAAHLPPPGYSVVEGYDYMLFTPAERIDAAALSDMKDTALLDGPVHVGFFSTNQRILAPDLQPGTYMVALRPAGEAPRAAKTPKEDKGEKAGKEGGAEQATSSAQTDGASGPWNLGDYVSKHQIDTKVDNLLFFDGEAALVGVVPALGVDFVTLGTGHTVALFDKDYTVTETDPAGEEIEVPVHEEWVRFDVWVGSRVARKGFLVGVGLRLENDLDTSGWRLSQR